MKVASVFCLLVIAFCSCSEPQVEKRVYTEKDIEGYWGTFPALHPSGLIESIADREDSISMEMLRFYNDVNGHGDSSYYVSGDSIFIRKTWVDWDCSVKSEFRPEFRISFVTNERLELCDLRTGSFIMYYSFLTLPKNGEVLKSLELNPWNNEGFIWSSDSFSTRKRPSDYCKLACDFYFPILRELSDRGSYEHVNQLFGRTIVKDLLLERVQPQSGLPRISGRQILISTGTKEVVLSVGNSSKDPCLRMIGLECDAVMKWILRNRDHL